jgi:hypothetical protein
MSIKRGMSKQQRLYYEHNNKEKLLQELQDKAKETRNYEDIVAVISPFDPHRNSFYN